RGSDWRALEGNLAFEKTRDLPRSFLDFERAGAIDQRAARLDHLACGGEQALLHDGETGDVVRALQMRHVRVAADGAGCRARRVEQNPGHLAARLPDRGIGGHRLDREIEAMEIADQAIKTALRAINGGD